VQIESERLESMLASGAAGSREGSIDAHAAIRRLNELPLVELDETSLAQ
jgi:hypothetical protein